MQFLDLRYLDDGTFIGPRHTIASMSDSFQTRGPSFGLHLNTLKCELFWPSGDQAFSEFHSNIRRVGAVEKGIEFLVSPIYGSQAF